MSSTPSMAAAPSSASTLAAPFGQSLTPPRAVMMATLLSVVGVFSILPVAIHLWSLWTTDPLESIGGLMPLASLVLILRIWRSLGWEMRGSWWGLGILAGVIALIHLCDHALFELIFTPSLVLFLPPISLVVLAYTAGVVLLFGGPRLFRAALFPIVLIKFVHPAPSFFTMHVDLPLQHASALVARGFAHALGQQLNSGQLRLMFTPDFGMFIAPGCDGIRGAITMGFIALIAGYVYRFRLRAHVLVVAGAVLLGYIFNFIRLCALVLYYIVALHIRWLQNRAEMGDYIIGACLFFFATVLLFAVIRRFSPGHDLRPPRLTLPPASPENQVSGKAATRSFFLRWGAFALLVLAGSISYARAVVHDRETSRVVSDPAVLGTFPQQVGHYRLQRRWNEFMVGSPVVFYYWADYVPEDGGGTVSIGISPVLGVHDSMLCHSARGESWLWHGDLSFPTARDATNFSSSLYNDGATQSLEATTLCTGTTCGQYSSHSTHLGFVYSRLDPHTLLSQSPTRTLPVLLRTETLDTSMPPEAARAELTANLRNFLSAANLSEFTRPYR